MNFKTSLIWYNALLLALVHIIGIIGLLTFNYLENPMTTLWSKYSKVLYVLIPGLVFVMYFISYLGMAAGAHRFWSHNSYKAKLPLRIFLMICFNACAQNSIYKWVKNHRMHHKYSDTNADPHNSKRGFFFTHLGWIMMKEHPEFIKKSKNIDLSDIMSDPVVIFNEKYFWLLQFVHILPIMVPVYLWNDTWDRAIISQIFIRYILTLNSVMTINSIAHAYGTKPYNKYIRPTDNDFLNYIIMGEGYHNYHHTFPWDYRSAELGTNKINFSTIFIDICAKLGLAYDLRYPSLKLIKSTILKNGDGSHSKYREQNPINCAN